MADPMAANQIAHLPRKASREARRLQLSEATIETIGPHGYARTTLTDVARQAGLSHGLVNFHFETKQKLFGETLRYLAEEYPGTGRICWLRHRLIPPTSLTR